MKNFNLIEWLSRNSHEKQSPQRFGRYAVMLIMLLTLGVGQMWANNTSVTFYYAVDATTAGSSCNDVKFCIKYGSGDGEWTAWTSMTKQDKTQGGKLVYKATYTFPWDGYYNWQFIVGSTTYEWYAGSWNSTLHNGQIYVQGSGWTTYSPDASYTVYFVNTNDWTAANVKAYAWNNNGGSACDYNADWSGAVMTSTGNSLGGHTIYKLDFNKRYSNIIFSNNGSSQTSDLTLGTTNAGKMYDNGTWKTYQFDITLDQQSGSGGTSSVTGVVGSAMPGSKTAPTRTGYTFGGYYTSTGGSGTCYYNASMVSQQTVSTSTPNTLYAKWTKKTYTVTVNNDGHGTTSPSGEQSNIAQVDGIAIDATANTNYEFVDWEIVSGTGSFASAATTKSNTFYPTSAATIRANFRSTLTYSLTVTAGTNVGTVTGSTDPVTLGNSYAISASNFTSGYEFNNWTASPAANASFASSTSASTNVTVSNGSVTVTANAREIMRTITISGGTAASTTAGVATQGTATAAAPAAGKKFTGWTLGTGVSLAGGYALTDRTIKFTATQASSVTANYADRAGVKVYFAKPSGWSTAYVYAWKGSDDSKKNATWPGEAMASTETINYITYYTYQYYTEADGIGGAATGSSEWDNIKFTDNGDETNRTADLTLSNGHYYFSSSAASGTGKATAPTSAWCIKGDWNSWNEDADQITHSAAATGSKSITLPSSAQEFKVYNIVNETWWRFSGNVTATKAATTIANNIAGNITITPSVAGPYTFALASLTGTPTLAITYPTSYTVTFNAETFVNGGASHSTSTTGGTLSAVDGNSAALSSGGKVISGGSAIITASKADGYTFIGFYTNAACTTAVSGAGVSISDNVLTYTGISSNKTVYAKFSENMTTVNLVASPTGKGTFTKGGAAVTSVSAGKTTKPEVTAVPATGYRVNTSATIWAKNNSNITLSSTTANPVTVTGAGTGGTSTLTATFTPKTYTITLHEQGATTHGTPGDGGTITATYDANTNLSTITALPARTGYTFGGYYATPKCDGTWIIKTDTYFNWDGTYLNSSTGVWKYDGNVDLYAKWTANRYTVTLDVDEANKGTTASATTSQNIYYDDATVTVPNRPTAANGYALDGYYTEQNGAGTKVINGDGTWIASVAGYTDASKHWVHADDVTLYAYYKKAEITALTLDAVVVETNATVGVTPTVSPTPEGTTKLWFYVFHGNDNPLDPQPTIKWNGTKATFNAGETSGTYKIGVALRTGTTYAGTLLDSTTVSYQVAGTHSVTVRYKCGDDVIKAASTLEGIRPLDWSDEITASDIIGYSFTGWTAGDGVTIKDDDGEDKTTSSSATIKIKAIYDGYLTANYSKKRIIYFNNTLNWDTVVVYFYKNSSYWGSTQGSGANTTYTFTNTPYSEGKHGGMQRVAPGSNIWYFDAEAAGVNASYQTIVFTDIDQHGCNYFYNNVKVIKRDDYYSTKMPMFVPLANQTPVSMNGNTANYYNNGYWMNYPENTGYTLKIYNQKAESGATELKSIPFEFTANKTMPMELDVDLEAGQTYGFKIWRNDGLNTGNGSFYGNTGTMTANTEGWAMTTDASSNTGLQTTAAGNYKFLLNFYEISSDYQYRVSVTYPVTTGDYRLLYKDDVHTLWHPSAIILKANAKDTVSFFVRKGQHANLKLQKCTALGEGTVTWTDTVTWWNGSSLPSAITKDSVYNICLTHNASTGKLEIENVEAYTGNYYIRVDAANSKWDNYRTDPDHLMTYSEYSITHGGYSHYYTHWVKTDDRKNIKFVIANDYSPCISDTLVREDASGAWTNITYYIESNGDLKRNANVRFMWNQSTNAVSRAYVDGAQGDHSANFLYILNTDDPNKIRWADESALTSNKVTFADNGNWIYEANVQAKPNAQIRLLSNWGTSNTITQYFKGSSSSSEDLVGGSGDTWYDIRVIYDFKTNRLLASWIPSGDISDEIEINADVMFIREHQGDIAQLTFSDDGIIKKIETAYGVLRLNKWTINNKDKSTHTPLASPKSRYERDLFYISFPFRVSMEEVFGFGTYGKHWIIEEYDGANRAAKGYWQESGPNWKFITNRKNRFFEPNQGYIIALELDELGESSSVWQNTDQVELYFPSYGTMSDITKASVNCTIPEHLCTINRSEESDGHGGTLGSAYDRRVKDSHWNVISVPTYVNTYNATFANTEWITTKDDTHVGPNFLYEWNPDDNSVTARSGVGYTYKAMHAYLVQYCGVITWTTSVSPAAAPRRNPAYRGNYEFCLKMLQDDGAVDQTFVKLSDAEAVTTGFEFNYDMSKEFNKSKANIYTIIGAEPAAGNVLPLTDQMTVVPVGVTITTTGDYTFSIPDGTEGTGVTLVDNETGIRTNLALEDYTVTLEAGTQDDRFYLEISPIKHVATGVEEITGDGSQVTGARKVMVDGILYIIKDGKVFSTQGARVK